MTHPPATFKSFEPRPGHTPCRLPALIEKLVGAAALPGYFGLDDLREMSKFREIPNVHGVAAYAIDRTAPGKEAWAVAPIAELPAGILRPLADRLSAEPLVLVQGNLDTFRLQAIAPQSHAHLAAALKWMLHPWPEEEGIPAADYTLLIWPEALVSRGGRMVADTMIGHWPDGARAEPGGGTGLIVGCDDPGLIEEMLADAAKRRESRETIAWAAKLEKASELAKSAEGRARALDVESWLFGVESDGDGHFPLLEGDVREGTGWAVAGRKSQGSRCQPGSYRV